MEIFIYILLGGVCVLVGFVLGIFGAFFLYMRIFANVIVKLPKEKLDAIVRIMDTIE